MEMSATCPECAEEIKLKEQAELGEIMACPCCSARLEIMSLAPVKIQAAPSVEEDWGE